MKTLLIKVIKILITEKGYKFLKKEIDYKNQKKIVIKSDKLIEKELKDEVEKYAFESKKDIKGKIIWQFWGQGWNYKELPKIVQLCYKSIEKFKGDYEIIRLDENNIKEYIDLPEFILKKFKNKEMGYTHFSDILRLALLKVYGGVWLDATILLTDKLSSEYETEKYFVFQRSSNTKDKQKWINFNDTYFSWNKKHKVNVLNSIIFSKKENIIISNWLNLILNFWKDENKVPHYFFVQILYNELVEKYLNKEKCFVVDDTLPHELSLILLENYSERLFFTIISKINIHKLTYKIDVENLNIKGTVLEYLMNFFEV